MSSNVEGMIDRLTPAIEQKCEELRAARKQRVQSRIFVLLFAMGLDFSFKKLINVPALLVFAGVSLTVLIAPLVFMSLSVVLLLPVLLSGKTTHHGGNVYEQA